MAVQIGSDNSYFKFHSSDTNFDINTATPKETDNFEVALEVDSGTWYVWYEDNQIPSLNGFYPQ